MRGDTAAVKHLLKTGASAQAQRDDGLSALECSLQHGNLALIDALLLHGASMRFGDNEQNCTALHCAAGWPASRMGVAKLLISAQGDMVNTRDSHGFTPLLCAARHGNTALIYLLLESGADAHAAGPDGLTFLHHLSRFSGPSGWLLDIGADVISQVDDAERLLNAQQPVSGQTALHMAAGNESLHENLIFLLRMRPDLRVPDNRLCTPLHVAAEHQIEPSVRALVSAGADKDARDENGSTPYKSAVDAGCGNARLLKWLIDGNQSRLTIILRSKEVSSAATQTAAVVAVLIVTVSYTALLSPPGGWAVPVPKMVDGSTYFAGPNENMPTFLPDYSEAAAASSLPFIVFMIFNCVALFSSIASLLFLLCLHFLQYYWSFHASALEDMEREDKESSLTARILLVGLLLLYMGIISLLAAGVAGPFLALYSTHIWVAYTLAAVAGSFCVLVICCLGYIVQVATTVVATKP